MADPVPPQGMLVGYWIVAGLAGVIMAVVVVAVFFEDRSLGAPHAGGDGHGTSGRAAHDLDPRA